MLREMFLAWARSVLLRPAFEQWKEALRCRRLWYQRIALYKDANGNPLP